jgi:hypothetical protein
MLPGMVYQRLNAYRVPINVSILDETAERILKTGRNPDELLEALGWGKEHRDFVQAGLAPTKDHKKLVQMIKDNALRRQLKEQRIARGYPTLVSPRTGLKGWVQKKFRDPKEQRLPITLDILAWLKELPRLQLLVAIHDGILAQVSSAEPRPVGADQQMNQFINPLAEMIRDNDASRIERVRQALAEPLPSIPAATVVDELAGYVISYDRNRGLAYYYGS